MSSRRTGMLATPLRGASIAEFRPPAHDELLELGAHAVLDRRLLVALERRPPDLAGPLGRVAPAHPRPAIEVLGRGEQRPVEALAEALERVHGAEEVTS